MPPQSSPPPPPPTRKRGQGSYLDGVVVMLDLENVIAVTGTAEDNVAPIALIFAPLDGDCGAFRSVRLWSDKKGMGEGM